MTTPKSPEPVFYRCDECRVLVAYPLTTVVVREFVCDSTAGPLYGHRPMDLCNYCQRRARERSV